MVVWLAFLLCSYGAEIMKNLLENFCSLSAQKYFWLKEPEIIKKILNGFLPVRAQKRFVLFDWFVFVHFSRIAEFSDYGENRIQEIMCFITWITINAHEFIINFFHIYNFWIIYGQFLAIHVQRNIWIRCWIGLDLCHPMTKMSYLGLSVNALCSRYLKIISCWPRTAKSTEGCNSLIISDSLWKSMKKRWFLRRKSYAFRV